MSVYSGAQWQRGYGLGSVFGSLLRAAVPVLKSTGKSLAKQALKTGTETGIALAQDALRGGNMKQAAKTRFAQAAADALGNVTRTKTIKRRAKRKRATPVRGRTKTKRKKTSKIRDIFD